MHRLRRPVRLLAGSLLLLLGIAVAPTPVPVGLLLAVVGLYLLAGESETLRRWLRALRRRLPALSRLMARLRPRLPGPVGRFIDLTDPCPPETGCRCGDAVP